MPDDVKTVILRFRDLVISLGGTIETHKAICDKDEESYVWWGWWSKAGERVPREVFGELKRWARSRDGLPLLLFDSGRRQLFRAHCIDIDWDNSGERMNAPDHGNATPQYYKNQRYLAWFKFESMDGEALAAPEEILRQYSYVQLDEFFETGASRYTRFYGKKVASLEELRQQDRSIWFVRDSKSTDPDNEIELLNARSLTPSHFPTDFTQTESTRLLWVSDLHFGDHHNFPLESDASSRSLALRIESAIEDNPELAGIIVSGDLTWKAEPEEYREARDFLDNLISFTRLETYQVGICPGNHDIRFTADPAEKGARVQQSGEQSREAYSAFYNDLFYLWPNDYLSCSRRFLLGGTIPIEIVFLNSSLLEQTQHQFQGHGFIGEAQLRDAANQLGWGENDHHHPLRIVVVHHHILPVTYRDTPIAGVPYSVALDAEALVQWLVKHRVTVVLHGHMHNPFYSAVTRTERFRNGRDGEHTFYIFGMGSSGVAEEHLGEIKENMITLLDFSPESLTVTYRRVHQTNAPGKIRDFTVDLSKKGGR